MSANALTNLLAPVPVSTARCDVVVIAAVRRRRAIDSLTTIRGLAALWVVLYHFQADIYTLLPFTRSFSPFLAEGHYAVPIFFVLSGYVLTYNYLESLGVGTSFAKVLRFWGRRLQRIYPLHAATLCAVLAMVLVARSRGLTISETGYSRRDFVLNLFLIHTWVPHFVPNWNHPSWSVSSEWFAYLFFPMVCLVFIRLRRITSLIGLALFFYAMSIGLIRLPLRAMTAVVGPFLLGCTFARAIGLGYVPRFGMRIGAWVFLLTLLLLPFRAANQVLMIGMITAGAALVFALAAAGEGCSRCWFWRPLIALGEVSYSLYLVHTIVQKLIYETAPAPTFADRSFAVRLLVVGGYATAIALATWVAHVWIDVSFRNALRRRFSL